MSGLEGTPLIIAVIYICVVSGACIKGIFDSIREHQRLIKRRREIKESKARRVKKTINRNELIPKKSSLLRQALDMLAPEE